MDSRIPGNEVDGRSHATPKVLVFDCFSSSINPPTMEGTEAANNNCSRNVVDIHFEWKPHSPSMPNNAPQTQSAARVRPAQFFWFWIGSLLLTTCVACIDIRSRYRASVDPSPETADGFIPWLLFWSFLNGVAFFHTTDDSEEYKPVLCFLPVITSMWFIAEIVITVRQSRRGQVLDV
ncbi:hypothetical protein BT69DRAFT_1277028 [Atractiella rhizophila]|nr:hypothetical protein BT69DRAFT_1277028 [Atractiella rhizophila]